MIEIEIAHCADNFFDLFIRDEHGEIVSWVSDEFREDPELIIVAKNAVAIALICGTKYLREKLQKPINY